VCEKSDSKDDVRSIDADYDVDCLLQFHLCSPMTRALLLSTYVKFINLFPEIKGEIIAILRSDTNLRSAEAELQQRASEYLTLANTVSTDVLVNKRSTLLSANIIQAISRD
jgi:hypothetical protein